jgi:hypothetical protein
MGEERRKIVLGPDQVDFSLGAGQTILSFLQQGQLGIALAKAGTHPQRKSDRPVIPPKPTDALEAAQVDGADGWRTFWWLTLPHLRLYLERSILLGSIYIVQNFDAVFTITQGWSRYRDHQPAVEIYQTMFRRYEYGEAAAGVVVVATLALGVVSSCPVRRLIDDHRAGCYPNVPPPTSAPPSPPGPTRALCTGVAGSVSIEAVRLRRQKHVNAPTGLGRKPHEGRPEQS